VTVHILGAGPAFAGLAVALTVLLLNFGLTVLTGRLEQRSLVRRPFFDGTFALEDAIELHAFAWLEALPCVWPMSFFSGVHGWHNKLIRLTRSAG
jgi:hypothetical protein